MLHIWRTKRKETGTATTIQQQTTNRTKTAMIPMKNQSYHLQPLKGSVIVVANQVIRVQSAGKETRFPGVNGQSTKWQRMRTYMFKTQATLMMIIQAVHK